MGNKLTCLSASLKFNYKYLSTCVGYNNDWSNEKIFFQLFKLLFIIVNYTKTTYSFHRNRNCLFESENVYLSKTYH